LFGDPSLAHAVENGLKLGQIRRIVASHRPGGADAGDDVDRVEREAGFDRGSRLIRPTKLSESSGQHEIRMRIASVGLDRSSTPRRRLFVTAEVIIRHARVSYPDVSQRIARTEA
jgi:hypothetical protein